MFRHRHHHRHPEPVVTAFLIIATMMMPIPATKPAVWLDVVRWDAGAAECNRVQWQCPAAARTNRPWKWYGQPWLVCTYPFPSRGPKKRSQQNGRGQNERIPEQHTRPPGGHAMALNLVPQPLPPNLRRAQPTTQLVHDDIQHSTAQCSTSRRLPARVMGRECVRCWPGWLGPAANML